MYVGPKCDETIPSSRTVWLRRTRRWKVVTEWTYYVPTKDPGGIMSIPCGVRNETESRSSEDYGADGDT